MADVKYVDADFVRVRNQPNERRIAFNLYFGDKVIIEESNTLGWTKITAPDRANVRGETISGFVKGTLSLRDTPILKASMVDVQQGDGMVIETPSGKIILVDGGDNKLFARHIAARFRARQSSVDDPLPIEAIIVTHGDADHFDGLMDIVESESLTGSREHKRIFIHPKRILHNGLVKGPSSVRQRDRLGTTVEDDDGHVYITELYEDVRDSPVDRRNTPFRKWIEAIDHWSQHGDIDVKRVGLDKPNDDLFDFLNEDDISIELHTPDVEQVIVNGVEVKGLKYLKSPPKTALLHEIELEEGGSLSASHTINGHSISFRMQYGNIRFLLTGDLNKDMMASLEGRLTQRELEAEILKTPHHGSADFDLAFLKKVRPLVSLISSGDENARKEYIHPRATLMNALGAASRYDTGIIFSTELAAFFAYRDVCYTRASLKRFFDQHNQQNFTRQELESLFTGLTEGTTAGEPRYIYAFERTQFGLIEIRTDGERLLVFTHSGKDEVYEAYSITVTRSRNGRYMARFNEEVMREG